MRKVTISIPYYVCKFDGWRTRDRDNKSGGITSHYQTLGKTYDKNNFDSEFDSVIETSDYWFCDKTQKKFRCNAVSAIVYHIEKTLGCDLMEYIERYPLMRDDLSPAFKRYKNTKMRDGHGKDSGDVILSPLDGKHYKRISYTHVKKYGFKSVKEFSQKYPDCPVSSEKYIIKAREIIRNGGNFRIANNQLSNSELDIINYYLTKHDITCQKIIDDKKFDFCFESKRTLFEIENGFHHSGNGIGISFTEMNSRLNDWDKRNIAKNNGYTIGYINYDELKNLNGNYDFDSLLGLANFNKTFEPIRTNDIIMDKNYISDFISRKGKDALGKNVRIVSRFIKQNFPSFITPDTDENIVDIMSGLGRITYDCEYMDHNKFGRIGSSYLKNKFMSFWKAKNNGMESIYTAWNADSILEKIIAYRMGINNNDEVFDISYKNILKGFEVAKYTVSWFKPSLAAWIYKKNIGNKSSPIVVDPCAGFGARMLGFYSVYPNGQYIACEPNKETYNELVSFGGHFKGLPVILPLFFEESLSFLPENPDYVFTCIPYWDKEIYSFDHTRKYQMDKNKWKDNFIVPLRNYMMGNDGCIIMDHSTYAEYFSDCAWEEIRTNTSPLNNTKGEYEKMVYFKRQ